MSLFQNLDLSFTGIKWMESIIFEKLTLLKILNLDGNYFVHLPVNFQQIQKSLQSLNLARNNFAEFREESFLGFKTLLHLNISRMATLKAIHNNTFARLEHLTSLDCSNNDKLVTFDLDSLLHCRNLIHVSLLCVYKLHQKGEIKHF